MRSDTYRMSIYEAFAKEAKRRKMQWIVLHGIEGYPDTIGRDLDAYCKNRSDILDAALLFEDVALQNKLTKCIVFPHPIWGKRVLAISKDYDVAELHILYKINSGIICYEPRFDSITSVGNFPVEESATEFKAIVMSLLGNSKKVLNRMEEGHCEKYSIALQKAYYSLKRRGKISTIDKLRIYFAYLPPVPKVIGAMKYSLSVKKASINAGTTKPVVFKNYTEQRFIQLKEMLSEVFTDFKCGNQMSPVKIKKCTAKQQLVYFTDLQCTVENAVIVDISDVASAADRILNSFIEVNANNRLAMFDF